MSLYLTILSKEVRITRKKSELWEIKVAILRNSCSCKSFFPKNWTLYRTIASFCLTILRKEVRITRKKVRIVRNKVTILRNSHNCKKIVFFPKNWTLKSHNCKSSSHKSEKRSHNYKKQIQNCEIKRQSSFLIFYSMAETGFHSFMNDSRTTFI